MAAVRSLQVNAPADLRVQRVLAVVGSRVGAGTALFDVPEIVAARCRALMARLGLVFGCFDFIVTETGDWVYLEVNEMGQFLFLEAWCPELHVLDAFCAFLVSGNPSFTYVMPKNPVRFVELSAVGELARRLKEARDRDALPTNPTTSALCV